ncbi:hypothetical protein [Streptomyces sp. 769]|uniref:hypothetical protein n=1 Tax=Streptomyces sp. 769 TaxID=1262452 RepID=UPI00058220A1|nr:hypothetical protein [Streptomyces sp. 769]AJC57059.1 hypothetical protein GZL_04481 [Streptomyces sp. 769]
MSTRDPAPWDTAPQRPVEDRLRRALAARADAVDAHDLRPAAPPGPHLRRARLPRPAFLSRFRPRHLVLPLAAAAGAAALALAAHLATAPERPPARPLPASPPSPATPAPDTSTPTPTPTPSVPDPSPDTAPGATRTRPGTPSGRLPHRTAPPVPSAHPTGWPGRSATPTPSASAPPPPTGKATPSVR